MKRTLISATAIALFALPMSVQAGPSQMGGLMDTSKSTAVKPLSAMKTTMKSSAKTSPMASKVSEPVTQAGGKAAAMGEEAGSAQKMLEDLEKDGKKKVADMKK